MIKETLYEQIGAAFLEAERCAIDTGYFPLIVCPSADGEKLYHVNIVGPGSGLSNVDIGAIHQVLGGMFKRLPTLKRFLVGLERPGRVSTGQHLEWQYLVTGSQRPLSIVYESDDVVDVSGSVREFWEIRTVRELKKGVS